MAELTGPTENAQDQIVPVLQGYMAEAKQNREGGLNPRDIKWEENLALYWNRYDHSKKAAWQAKVVMPEVPAFVDRFAAALKEALVASPSGFYTVMDPADKEGDLTRVIKRMTDVWLSTCGRNQVGTPLGFSAVFEEQCKMGALMAMSSVVLWKNDLPGGRGRVAVEAVDPRMVWFDHTYQNTYRIRRTEIDKHNLQEMVRAKDSKGASIWNLKAIEALVDGAVQEEMRKKEDLTGHGHQASSTRQTITLDEYIATVVSPTGEVLAKDALMVVANDHHLIRGPESNPFWHKKDWLTYTPLVVAPLSVYGRSYMEDFGSVAETFTQLTNLILDAVQTSAIRAYAVVPEMLINPGQLNDGVSPNKMFLLEGGQRPEDFFKALELGMLPPECVQVWTAIKAELREAADINEIGLGQFAPKGRTSATEVSQTQESTSALIRSVAQTIETRWLNPTLDLVWQTGLQHVTRDDKVLRAAAGEEWFDALMGVRKDLIGRPVTFQAMGISMLIQKQRMLKTILNLFTVLAQSDVLLQAFLAQADLGKVLKLLFSLSDIDLDKLTLSERERAISQFSSQMQAPMARAEAAPPAPPAAKAAMGEAAKAMGVSR